MKNNPFKAVNRSRQVNVASQKKITDYALISPTMQLAVDLAVHKGLPFSTFNDPSMRKLTTLAKKGNGDQSSTTINSENVVSSIHELAKQKRDQISAKMKGKIVSLSADMATCESRSFIGKP